MAHANIKSVENDIVSILKINHKGWDIKLFADETKAAACLCATCDAVCCDAVELGCDHQDDDIYLYCNQCLIDLIKDNNNKCPINLHDDPAITSNRTLRRQISKSLVICPYSLKYKSKQNILNDIDIHQVVDTMGSDEKEGIVHQQNMRICDNNEKNIGCRWNGTLTDLINKHIVQCSKKYDPSYTLNITIKELQNENKTLSKIINDKQSIINQQSMSIKELKEQNQKLKIISADSKRALNQNNSLLDELQNKLREERTITKLLRRQNEELQHKVDDQQEIISALTSNDDKNTCNIKHEEMKNQEPTQDNLLDDLLFGASAPIQPIQITKPAVSSGGKKQKGFVALKRQLDAKVLGFPRSHETDQILFENSSISVSYFKIFKQQKSTLCVFISNLSNKALSNIQINVKKDNKKCELQFVFDVNNSIPKPNLRNTTTAIIESINSGGTACQMITYGLHFPSMVSIPCNIVLSINDEIMNVALNMSDLLRPSIITTKDFGINWGKLAVGSTAVNLNIASASIPNYVSTLTKKLHCHHIETINKEAIAAANLPSIVNSNMLIPILIHCKCNKSQSYSVIIRTSNANISKAIGIELQQLLSS